jgi:septin family protein
MEWYVESRRLRTWILNLYIEPLRNSTNQLYYSKGYRTIEIVGCFA